MEKHYKWRKQYRHKIIDRTRLLGRIHYWRKEQTKLTQQHLPSLNSIYFE